MTSEGLSWGRSLKALWGTLKLTLHPQDLGEANTGGASRGSQALRCLMLLCPFAPAERLPRAQLSTRAWRGPCPRPVPGDGAFVGQPEQPLCGPAPCRTRRPPGVGWGEAALHVQEP